MKNMSVKELCERYVHLVSACEEDSEEFEEISHELKHNLGYSDEEIYDIYYED